LKNGKLSTIFSATVCAGASALALAGGAAPAQAATACTWGGTPDNPTGHIEFVKRGLTDFPAPFALPFRAWGVVEGGGPCHGQTVTFDGQFNAGSGCLSGSSFEGRLIGLPGVAWVWGMGPLNLVHEFDYDTNGNLVGTDEAIAQGPKNDPLFSACNTPQGIKDGFFSGAFALKK